jgi:[CysO sulfur-carrier protein]-S-L-cysteine hydrolase
MLWKKVIYSRADPFYMKKNIWQQMIHHCISQLPCEACGLLSGKNDRAETLWIAENIKKSPTAFEMNPTQIDTIFQWIQSEGEDMTGIFHSHPTYPEKAYIIVSLADHTVKVGCYYIHKPRVIPLSLQLI